MGRHGFVLPDEVEVTTKRGMVSPSGAPRLVSTNDLAGARVGNLLKNAEPSLHTYSTWEVTVSRAG